MSAELIFYLVVVGIIVWLVTFNRRQKRKALHDWHRTTERERNPEAAPGDRKTGPTVQPLPKGEQTNPGGRKRRFTELVD